jgi:DNA-binding protein HU-beta
VVLVVFLFFFLFFINMNKAELIDAIAAEASLTKADAKRALDAFVGATSKALKKGDRVALVR